LDESWLKINEVDERFDDDYRIAGKLWFLIEEYRLQVEMIGHNYLQFISDLDYKPYLPNTVEIVEGLLTKLTQLRRIR